MSLTSMLQAVADVLRAPPLDREHQENCERQKIRSLNAGLKHNFAVVAGDSLFRDSLALDKMRAMFPGGSPIETDIYSIALREFPRSFSDELRRVAELWRDVFAPTPMFLPEPSSYHISVAVPQDVARHANAEILQPWSSRLSNSQLYATYAITREILSREEPFALAPVGFRIGADGALIFVFDYHATLQRIRRTIIGMTNLLTGGKYTGRPKPLICVTLARALENPELDSSTASRVREFGDEYGAVDGILSSSLPVDSVTFAHEKRWMFTDIGFEEALVIGSDEPPDSRFGDDRR